MLSIGIKDSDDSGVTAIPLHASTKPSSTWREDAGRKSGDRFNPKGHPRVWLIGDSMHAMQPNRCVNISTYPKLVTNSFLEEWEVTRLCLIVQKYCLH